MSEEILHCADCRVKFRTKAFDSNKAYKCPKCGSALKAAEQPEPEEDVGTPDEPEPSPSRPRWLTTTAWVVALGGAAAVGWLTGPRRRLSVLPEPKALTPRKMPVKGPDARATTPDQAVEARPVAGGKRDVPADGKDAKPPSGPEPSGSEPERAASAAKQQTEATQTASVKVDGVTQAALDALDSRLTELMLLRQYDEALGCCNEALRDPEQKGASAAVVAQHVARWRAQIESCRSLTVDARTGAAGLAGKTVEVEIRVGKKGWRRISGEVAGVEDEALLLRTGGEDRRVPMSELGPFDVMRVASGKDLLAARRRVLHARFLLTEGREEDAVAELKCAGEQGREIPEVVQACAQAQEFFTFWQGRQRRLKAERDAQVAAGDLKEAYAAGRWELVADIAARLNGELADTVAYRDDRTLIDVLCRGARKHEALDEARRQEIGVWQRLGPSVPVPVPRGKPRPMPAGIVVGAAISPGGKHLAVAHAFGVDLWAPKTQELAQRLDGHELAVTCLGYATKGKLLATGSMDATVRLWDTRRGEVVHTFRGHTSKVTGVCFSPKGRWLAGCADDGTVRVWDVGKGKSIGILKGHKGSVVSIAFTKKGRRLLSVDGDHAVRLWDPAKEKLLWTAKCGPLAQATLSPDGDAVALAGKDGKVRLLSSAKGTEMLCLAGHNKPVSSVCFDRSGQWLASSGGDRTVRLWRLPQGELVRFYKHILAPRSVSFSPDGRWLLSSCLGVSQLWDVKSGKGRRLKARSGASSVSETVFSSDGRWAAALSPVSGVVVYALPGGELMDRVGGYAPGLRSVALSPDGSSVATGTVEGVELWPVAAADTASKPIRRWSLLSEPCVLTSFSPDGRRLAASQRAAVWVGDAERKTKGIALAAGKKRSMTALVWRQNGAQLATGGSDAVVLIWDSTSGKQLRALKKHKKGIVCLATSPDGRQLASAGGDKTLCVWDWSAGKLLKQHKIAANAMCYDPQGRWLACASNGKVSLVDALSGKEVRGLASLGAPILCLDVSSDGSRIACGDSRGRLTILDVESGKAIQEVHEHRMPVTHVSFSRSEPVILASRSSDGTVCVMKAGLADLGEGRRGAGEVAWLDELFDAAGPRPASVIDLELSQVAAEDVSRVREQQSSKPDDWLGGSQLCWRVKAPADRIKIHVNVARAGQYLVGARLTRLPDCGTLQLRASEQAIGAPFECAPTKAESRTPPATETVRFGLCSLTDGRNELELTADGITRESAAYTLGIDAIVLWPEH